MAFSREITTPGVVYVFPAKNLSGSLVLWRVNENAAPVRFVSLREGAQKNKIIIAKGWDWCHPRVHTWFSVFSDLSPSAAKGACA